MTRDIHKRVTEVFFKVCDLDDADCARVLAEECNDEPDVRSKVEALLSNDRDNSRASLTQIVEEGAGNATRQFIDKHQLAPSEIGPFSVVKEIGEGGMSVVYEAQQSEPVKRRVALKVIRPGMDTREVIARFESERQALAVMDHPNIAKIFDGGATSTGRPYFVMELVHGVPITDYCDSHRLSIRARLALFVDVCAAIQHAHQKGVVHRDLKPSNIMVTEHDNKPVPKVIDFGIAKAVDASLSDDPLLTRMGQMVGTPGYMSPEQAYAKGHDIDTRTDVYSLGVVLYQLLCGALPFDIADLMPAQIPALIRDRNAPRPSVRFSTLSEQRVCVAAARSSEVPTLTRSLASSLDWIALKAMEKDPQRRYQSVSGFIADIDNYLAYRPVEARPPSHGYVFGQFVRRNRKAVGAVSLILLALIGGVTVATMGLLKATAAERVASKEALTSKATLDFMVELFKSYDPTESLGDEVKVGTLFERGVNRLQALDKEPEVQATLMHTMALAYSNMAEYDKAKPLFERALRQREAVAGNDNADVAATLVQLGAVQRIKEDYDDARGSLRAALEIRRRAFGEQDVSVAATLVGLGTVTMDAGDYDEAEQQLRQAVDIYRAQATLDKAGRVGLSEGLNNLAVLLDKIGDIAQAEQLYREALQINRELLADNHPDLAQSYNNLGTVLAKQGRTAEAEQAYRQALRIREHVFGADHPTVGVTLNNLGLLLRKSGDYDGAELLYRRSLDIRRKQWGDAHASVATALNNLAGLLQAKGEMGEAETTYRDSLRVRRAAQGDEHPNTAITQMNLASILNERGKYADGCAQVDAALPILQRELGATHWRVALALNVRGECYAGQGDYAAAEPLLLTSLAALRDAKGVDDMYTQRAVGRVVALYRAWDRPDDVQQYETLLTETAQP